LQELDKREIREALVKVEEKSEEIKELLSLIN